MGGDDERQYQITLVQPLKSTPPAWAGTRKICDEQSTEKA